MIYDLRFMNYGLRLVIFGLFLFFANTARAQTSSELLLTWEARNYAPPEYVGKHLATPGSIIAVSAELIAGGKLQDARRLSFSWYVDGKIFQKGVGLKEISFPVQKSYGNEYTVRVVARYGGKDIEGVIRIPTSRPELIIQHPYQNNLVTAAGDVKVRARPYFFTISSLQGLRVSWALNDVPNKTLSGAEEFVFSPKEYQGREVKVSARASNSSRANETREAVVRLNVR